MRGRSYVTDLATGHTTTYRDNPLSGDLMTAKPPTPRQIAAVLARTKDPDKAHDLYRGLLTALPSGTNIGPFIASAPVRRALNPQR